ncbi:HD domain-containing protein [bacterium]|nr:HD domain-containing protein [bacterium]
MINKYKLADYPQIKIVLNHDLFLSLECFRHHAKISCLQHTLEVAELTFKITRRLGLDYVSATRGALLHDFYLYDWHKDSPGLHGFKHPAIALRNAKQVFDLNPVEENAILRHMWPLTPLPPRYPESVIVSLADKTVSIRDYGYIFLKHPAFSMS